MPTPDVEARPIRVTALAGAVAGLVGAPAFTPRVPHEAGLRYRPGRRHGTLADVYLPDSPAGAPSVVLVHGGGFLIGSRGMNPIRFLATRLAEAGYAAVTFDYRLLLRGARHLDDQVDDVAGLLAWWGEQQARYGLDPARTSAAGLSAGASLLLLAAARAPLPLCHLVSVFALYDLAGLSGRLPGVLGRLLLKTGDRETWRARSPLAQGPLEVPMTLLHGTADGLTPVAQAERFAAQREAVGLPTRLHIYEGAPHGFFNDPRRPVAEAAFADFRAALDGAAPIG